MLTSTLLPRALPVSIVVLVVSLFTGLASAGDGQDLAQACVRSIGQTATQTVDHMQARRDRGIAKIRDLDAAGARDRAIVGVGVRTNAQIAGIGSEGASRIAETARVCVRRLHDLGADEALIAAVRQAAERAIARIGNVAERSAGAVSHAVAHAVDG